MLSGLEQDACAAIINMNKKMASIAKSLEKNAEIMSFISDKLDTKSAIEERKCFVLIHIVDGGSPSLEVYKTFDEAQANMRISYETLLRSPSRENIGGGCEILENYAFVEDDLYKHCFYIQSIVV